ncbi:ABC transporter substrate-binding protein [Paenibacillus sp. GCM10027629]
MRKSSIVCLIVACSMSLAACSGGQNGDEKKEGKKTVVLSVFSADPVYTQAEKKYEASHPNVDIQIKAHMKDPNASYEGEGEKYINITNTELLSGKGADIIAFDVMGLPVVKYVDKKVLVNLSDLMKQDQSFDASQYEMNILDGAKMNGGLYTLPLRFFLDRMMGDAKAIEDAGVTFDDSNWTWNDFTTVGKSLAASGKRKHATGNTPPEQMLNYLFSDNYAGIVKDEKRFDTNAFSSLMKQVKKMYDDEVVTKAEIAADESYFLPTMIISPEDYFVGPAMFYEKGKIYNKPRALQEQSGGSFIMNRTLGINANSDVQAEAWDFMKFLMSEEAQMLPGLQGFSINKSVNEKMFKDLENKGSVESPTGSSVPVSKEDLEVLKQMVADTKTTVREDKKIQSIIEEEAKAYFSGQKSEQAVADLIANRITTYLNE